MVYLCQTDTEAVREAARQSLQQCGEAGDQEAWFYFVLGHLAAGSRCEMGSGWEGRVELGPLLTPSLSIPGEEGQSAHRRLEESLDALPRIFGPGSMASTAF